MSDLEQLIKTRRTVHQFTPERVPDETVEKALELSMWAPNHRLTYPWRYTIVSDEKRKALIDLAVHLKREKDPSFSQIKEVGLRKRLGDPSHWVSLGLKKNSDPSVFQEDIATLGCSVQIASLYLWEKGIASKWSTGKFSTHPDAYKVLDVDPEEIFLMGVLFVGVADITPKPSPRPPLSEILKRK